MKLYNRYILSKINLAFFAILLLLVALIWFSRTISFVRYIIENGVELQQFLFLFLLILPWLLLFIIPISLFVAILLIYNRLTINNEITILKNSGLTKFAISRPAILIALMATIFCFVISFFLMPYANKKLRMAKVDFENNYSNLAFGKGTFEALKSLTIYVKDKDENNKLYGILLHDEREADRSITITAQSGSLLFEEGRLLLYMENGTVQRFVGSTNKSEILNFDDYVFNLSENSVGEERSAKWKPKERYLGELLNPENASEVEIAKYKAEFQQRLTYPLMSIALALIALAAILYGNFSRHGSAVNIAAAIIFAAIFVIIEMVSYQLIEKKIYFSALLYLNFIMFTGGSIYALISSKLQK